MPADDVRHIQRAGRGEDPQTLHERVVGALSDVYDPCCREKGISVVDMGLLEDVRVEAGRATVEIVLTTGWCPFAVHLLESIRERAQSVPGVEEATVEVNWRRPWTTERLSDDARRKLRFLPDPADVDRDAYLAARLTPEPGRLS